MNKFKINWHPSHHHPDIGRWWQSRVKARSVLALIREENRLTGAILRSGVNPTTSCFAINRGLKTKKAHPVSQDELDIEVGIYQTVSLTYLLTYCT